LTNCSNLRAVPVGFFWPTSHFCTVGTLMTQQVLAESEWHGRLTAVDLRSLSPLKWQHVNPYGTFKVNMQEQIPLEQTATLPKFGPSLG
jgi:hypothetical protein